jgi:hypothetical protein
MTFIMPYDRLSEIVSSTQLTGEVAQFLAAINFACLALGFIVAIAIIPSLLRGKTAPKQPEPEKTKQ